jgi:hypothetical protein
MAGLLNRVRTVSSWRVRGFTVLWHSLRTTRRMGNQATTSWRHCETGRSIMPDTLTIDLDNCTEYRLALEARPPAMVHGTLALLVALVGVALAWSAFTHADLVVRAQGRVRPVTAPRRVFVFN